MLFNIQTVTIMNSLFNLNQIAINSEIIEIVCVDESFAAILFRDSDNDMPTISRINFEDGKWLLSGELETFETEADAICEFNIMFT